MAMKSTMAYLGLTTALLISAAASAAAATAYSNHTVGGSAGWFFNVTTNTSSANYSAWAANETFNLGDYLIFNTNTNQTVIQTYSLTTYRNCSIDDSSDSDTFQYGGGSNQFGQVLTVAVPLTFEGTNYYFSAASDGIQCQQGMAFEIAVRHGLGLPPSLNQSPPIAVRHGLGLPPSLNQSPPPPYVEPPSPGEDDLSPPITIDANEPSGAVQRSGAIVRWVVCVLLSVAVLLLG